MYLSTNMFTNTYVTKCENNTYVIHFFSHGLNFQQFLNGKRLHFLPSLFFHPCFPRVRESEAASMMKVSLTSYYYSITAGSGGAEGLSVPSNTEL